MKRLLLCITLISVSSLGFSALVDNRYSGAHSGNSLGYRGGNYQSGGVHSLRGPSAPSAPGRPGQPSHPARPAHPGAPGAPTHPRRPSGPSYTAPAAYGSGRPLGGHSQYSAPAPTSYSAPHNSYGSNFARGPSHYGAPGHSAYQPQRPARAAGNTYPQQQQHSSFRSETQSQSHGREMKYTIRDPNNRGTTHVTETHVVSNREMHGAEAEAAMKKLMGSMGPGPSYGSDGGFQDFVKNMGLPYF